MSARIKAARAANSGDPGYRRAMPGTGYAGDPGLFGSLGKFVSGAASFVPGPIGFAGKALSKVFGSKRGGRGGMKSARPAQGVRGFNIDPSAVLPFGRPFIQSASAACAAGNELGGPKGHHLNKTGYYRGGRPKSDGPLEYVPARTQWVRNRRRNPANPRATDRAIGRIESAKRMASRLGRITIRKKACA